MKVVLKDSAVDQIIADTPVIPRHPGLSSLERAMIASAQENEARIDEEEGEEEPLEFLRPKKKIVASAATVRRRDAKRARTHHEEKHCRCSGGRGRR